MRTHARLVLMAAGIVLLLGASGLRLLRSSSGLSGSPFDLQAALAAAHPGDVLELPAGATFIGNFVLPSKPGSEWITIRSSAHERLPPSGSRVSPSDATLMPKIVSPNAAPALTTASKAARYRIIGIEVTTTSPVNSNLVRLEAPRQTSLDRIPTDILIDRCYIHGTPAGSVRRGIVLNGARLAVVGSYLSDFHDRGADSQAITGWNGPGPFQIVNNYLEAAGENVMFGGADPAIDHLVPADIEIRGNHFDKPLSWRVGDPAYAGIPWTVKNLFELKNARRVVVRGNIFEHNWIQADQHGFAVVFTPRNQQGRAPWSEVADVTFTDNVVRHSVAGIQLLGWDYLRPSQQTRRIVIRNNLFTDIGGPQGDGNYFSGTLVWMMDGAADVVIDHNTALQSGSPIVASVIVPERKTQSGFVFTNNIARLNQNGVSGDGTLGDPGRTLATYFPGAVFEGNVLVGRDGRYPPQNFFPPSVDAIGFVNLLQGDYRLAASSRYSQASDAGSDPGVDVGALRAALGPVAWASLMLR